MNGFWSDKKVCITGAAGFLGSNLAARLVAEGAGVRGVDNFERGREEYLAPVATEIEFKNLDLRDPESAHQAVKGCEIVFHLASKVGGIKVYLEQPGTILTHNLLIDQNIFRAVVEEGVSSLLYASSAHVYPEQLQTSPDAPPLTEGQAYPAAPGLSYGWAKLMGERALLGWTRECDNLSVALARIVGAYGYNQDIGLDTGSVIPVFCHRAAIWPEGAPFRIWGTGEETRSYCFVDDIIEGFLRGVKAQETRQVVGPFNLGAEGRVTIREIAELVVAISGKEISLEFDPSVETTIWGQAVSCELAGALLDGWKPAHTLEQGLRLTYKHVADRLLV